MRTLRLRQAVVASWDRESVTASWRSAFGLGMGYDDPGVGEFGLCNAVVPVGDAFLEVVQPKVPGAATAAGRHLERNGGDCGYMAIFQVADIEAARAHIAGRGIRTVWNADLPTISGTHLHPADIGGAIVSIDEPRPASSWLWAGPSWTEQSRTEVVRGLAGLVIADGAPLALARTWSEVLALPLVDRDGPCLELADGGTVRFVDDDETSGRTGITGIDLRATDPAAAGSSCVIAGVTFRLVA